MAITNIGELIREHATVRGDRVMVRFGERDVTWAQMHERSSRFASALVAAGVGSQERVAYIEKNGVEYFEMCFGCGKANAVSVAVNWRLAAPEMLYTVNDAAAKVLVVGPDFFGHVEQIESQLTSVELIVAIGDHPRWQSYEDWLGAAPPVDPCRPVSSSDVALQLYTSGTTGLPKGVMTSNDSLFKLLGDVSPSWAMHPEAVNLAVMPLFHIGGCGWAMAGQFRGAKTVLVRDFVPDQVLEVIRREKVSTAFFVPAMLQFMAMVPGAADGDYSSLEKITYGASPITSEVLLSAMRTFKCDFVQVYGATETTGAVTQLEPSDHDPGGPREHLLRSAGRPYPWVEVKIVDIDSGKECAPGAVGEVLIRSPQNMLGYWNKPDETAKALLSDGFYRTGDAGYVDDEGFLFLTDRVKDMIVSGGENVYPAEVENALASHPAIAEVAVIGVPSERWGETVKAIVVLRAGKAATPPELIAFSKERLAGYKCPTSVDFIDVLPRNPSGKVLKKDLRAPYWAGRDRAIN